MAQTQPAKDYYGVALAFTLPSEGGVSNVKGDHGGLTNRGATQGEYDSFRTRHGLPLQPVTEITTAELLSLYREDYWLKAHCNEFGPKTAVCMFDWAVNHGPSGALKTLQTVLAVEVDGDFGNLTRKAALDMPDAELAEALLVERYDWYERDVKANPDQAEFLHGWDDRIKHLRAYIAGLGA